VCVSAHGLVRFLSALRFDSCGYSWSDCGLACWLAGWLAVAGWLACFAGGTPLPLLVYLLGGGLLAVPLDLSFFDIPSWCAFDDDDV
jgi:hypothetical protein